ncbi:MAG: hypothetical protein IPK85_04840 [Gemmatimonadetes bacterium]|nr:hypothetical protein [Gemmatimonadota bacterium]
MPIHGGRFTATQQPGAGPRCRALSHHLPTGDPQRRATTSSGSWRELLTNDTSLLAPDVRLGFREYHALLAYTLQRREKLDRPIEALALSP